MKLCSGRFQKETDTLVNDFNSSIQFDARLYKQDIAGSIAHAQMLGKQGIIEEHEVEQIVEGLKAILADIEADKVEFSVDNEDIHMNIETLLTQRIERTGEDTVIATRKTGPGRWEQITTGEFHRMVLAAAKGFIAFGIRKGDAVSIFSPPAGNGVCSTSHWPRSAR